MEVVGRVRRNSMEVVGRVRRNSVEVVGRVRRNSALAKVQSAGINVAFLR